MLHYSGDTPHCPACFEGLWFFSPSCSVRKSMLELFGFFCGVFSPMFYIFLLPGQTPKRYAYHGLVLYNLCGVIG